MALSPWRWCNTKRATLCEQETVFVVCVRQLCSFYNSFPAGCGQDRQGQPPATYTQTHTCSTHCAPGLVSMGSEYCHDGLRPSVTQTALSQKASNDIDLPSLSPCFISISFSLSLFAEGRLSSLLRGQRH